MKRAIFVTTGTVVGLVGVLSYTPPEVAATAIPGATEIPTPSPTSEATVPQTSPTPTATGSTKATATSKPTATSTASSTPSSAPTKTSNSSSGTYNGDTIQTRWGPVQVQIVVSNGKITAVNGLQYPYGDRRSQMISSYAVPELQRQTLSAQSANIDGVSGASYTTMGWVGSLKSALTKAGL